MLGHVANDPDGLAYINFLKSNGVDTSLLKVNQGGTTGQAYVLSL